MALLEMSPEMEFEWDDDKARTNFRKHGVKFETAIKVFSDKNRLNFHDDLHSSDEERFITIGMVNDVLFVVYTMRAPNVRIISARKAQPKERRLYYDSLLQA